MEAVTVTGPNPSGLCMCGCGDRTPIAHRDRKDAGWVKGEPILYCKGHQRRGKQSGRTQQIIPANPGGLCMCGCGETTGRARFTIARLGLRKGDHRLWIKGHSQRPGELWMLDAATGCWNWHSAKPRGYGYITVAGQTHPAHRWVYEQHRGPIPEGLQIDHLCRNRRCVNPDHLEAVTSRENTRRGSAAKLTPEMVRDIRENGGSRVATAARLGISVHTVWAVRAGRVWADV